MLEDSKGVDLLIIVPPAGIKHGVYPPYGAMYIASAIRNKGYNPKILDLDVERITYKEIINKVKEIDPAYIGFSAVVAPSYKFIKELSLSLKNAFPDKIQILGGGLSSAAEPVLKNMAIDIVVRGEGDVTIVELIDCLDKKEDLHKVQGIHFKEGENNVFTGDRRLILQLDTLSYPAFDLIDMDKYLPDGVDYVQGFAIWIKDKRIYDKKRKRRMMTIATSRGCFGKCSFCFRAYPGIRVNSVKYVFDLIEYCIEKFNVGFFSFGDECFAPNKARNWAFIEEFKKRKLDIIFKIQGMRVDTVDRDILRAFKEIGCWMIEYGFESGSQKMLNIINKRVTVEQNRSAGIWTHEEGMFTSPALILAMPGETEETIDETIAFLKSLNFNFKQYQWKYTIPIPGSALYEYARLTEAIKDEDEYLMSLAPKGASGGAIFNINLTEQPDEVVAGWNDKLKTELDNYYLRRKYKNPLARKFMRILEAVDLHRRRKTLFPLAARKIKSFLVPSISGRKDKPVRKSPPRFRKNRNVRIDDFLEGVDCSVLNSEASLKSINKRLRERKANNAEK